MKNPARQRVRAKRDVPQIRVVFECECPAARSAWHTPLSQVDDNLATVHDDVEGEIPSVYAGFECPMCMLQRLMGRMWLTTYDSKDPIPNYGQQSDLENLRAFWRQFRDEVRTKAAKT
jgi:hypothetical protein